MNFRTIVKLPDFDFEITHKHKCLLIGSCFAENMGEKLSGTKIPNLVNPTGINYNPASIYNTLRTIMELSFLKSEDLFLSNELWNSFSFHSKFSGISKNNTLENINNSIEKSNSFLKSCDYLFITLGTSYYYLLKEKGIIVSNCHKQPSEIFERKFLEPECIKNLWNDLIKELKAFNTKLKIIFTVSPIRHWKDGAIDNMYSKSSLHLAIRDLLINNEFKDMYYFPAYEIVNDELRDYRFYAEDMIHPSATAIEYIWERFGDAFFSNETIILNKKINKIIQASKHRPFNKDTNKYKVFCEKILNEILTIENNHPYLNMDEEKNNFI